MLMLGQQLSILIGVFKMIFPMFLIFICVLDSNKFITFISSIYK